MSANTGRIGYHIPVTAELIAGEDPDGNVAVLLIDDDGNLKVTGGGSGGGDATAANQVLEIAELGKLTEQILDYDTSGGSAPTVVFGIATPSSVGPVGVSNSNPLPALTRNVFALPECQYIGQVDTSPTVVTFTGRLTNSGGTIVWVVVITYSDSTRQTPLSFARTT